MCYISFRKFYKNHVYIVIYRVFVRLQYMRTLPILSEFKCAFIGCGLEACENDFSTVTFSKISALDF